MKIILKYIHAPNITVRVKCVLLFSNYLRTTFYELLTTHYFISCIFKLLSNKVFKKHKSMANFNWDLWTCKFQITGELSGLILLNFKHAFSSLFSLLWNIIFTENVALYLCSSLEIPKLLWIILKITILF